MWDNRRCRSIIWSNLPDLSMSEMRDVIGRGRKRKKLISRGSALISRLVVFTFKSVEISVSAEKSHPLEISRNNSCIHDGER